MLTGTLAAMLQFLLTVANGSARPCSDTVVPTVDQASMKQVRYLFFLAIVVICCHQLYIKDGHNPSLILWLVSFYSENFSLLPSDCEILRD